jgi:hypothetical protein
MIPDTPLHRLAACLLRAGIRLAPGDAREWGNAMLGELQHIEGNWAAVAWALGGAGVLAKQALIALLLPTRDRQAAPVGNPLAREAKMHKASLISGGACLAVVLLFFLAPVFRQAFRVSLAQWYHVIHVEPSSWLRQPELESFARRVEKNQDAEGMAFVAARLNNPDESVRLAEVAVRLDPKLTWILGVAGARHSGAPEVPAWVQKLKKWDPGNALPYLILAQRDDMESVAKPGGWNALYPPKRSAAWMGAMAGAFNSDRIDDYRDRRRTVDRTVARRYGLSDPALVVEERTFMYRLPTYATWDSVRYAILAIDSGKSLEARGDLKGAIEKYLQVAHFVRAFRPHASYPVFLDTLMPPLYGRLAAIYRKTGDATQSAYFADLTATAKYELERDRLQWHSEMENRHSILGVASWNALVVEASDVVMLASFCLLLIALIVVFAQSGTLKLRKLRIGPVTTGVGLLGAAGLLVSSITLYVAYRPYAAIYSRFLQTGDTSQLKTLRDFLGFTRSPIGTQFYRPGPLDYWGVVFSPYISAPDFTFYFWLAVTVLGVATLAAIAARHLLKRDHPPAGAAA